MSTNTLDQPRKRGAKYEGKPCNKCGGTERYVSNTSCVTCRSTYSQSPEGKAYYKAYGQSPEGKAYQKTYDQSPKRKSDRNIYYQGTKGRSLRLFQSAKRRASHNGIPFTISRDDVHNLLSVAEQKWKEIEIEFAYKTTGNGTERNGFAPSLDQIKAGEGYTPTNIQIVPWAWNAFKGDWFTDAQAIEFCDKVSTARDTGTVRAFILANVISA